MKELYALAIKGAADGENAIQNSREAIVLWHHYDLPLNHDILTNFIGTASQFDELPDEDKYHLCSSVFVEKAKAEYVRGNTLFAESFKEDCVDLIKFLEKNYAAEIRGESSH